MFMQRLITTLVLVPLVLLILFYAPAWFLGGVVLLILLVAGRECWGLIPLNTLAFQIGFLVLLVFGLWACGYLFSYWLILGLVVWALNCIAILTFPNSQHYWGYPAVVAGVCFLLLPLFLQSLIHLYYLPQGKTLLVYLLFLIWASDIGAYITGKRWGKHKLIPQVSPGKSWEGVAGGVILAMVVAVIGFICFKPNYIVCWFGLALATVIISIFGDLFISILKRRCHLKDTGTLIPGHGGILDRLDSLIAALPLFYFGLTYIPRGV
ncbi:phosphatidate cytidylyltransferase [Legionella maioricensis]|uniref:Phosphatidate cytidylyltransferase n=1 Tax=Legionella maioricensis TaxID=2896528 RepID=A0A9X2IC42_9GAMM|nr:phosphatidate cytidylyltransferase [Legionella maioricensis]MCL9683363.1 phosphatidate cytidylyltransferase [Legionella maioricensis]MCL9685941.1 phosphatidate cytidylyltransferase [Legionella maioricensis]